MRKMLTQTFLETIRRASTDLPPDVERAIRRASRAEARDSTAAGALRILLENVAMARAESRPMCQDTGTNTWWIHHPVDVTAATIRSAVLAATRRAVRKGFLRPNAVDPVTGENSGDNTGVAQPVIHLEQWNRSALAADVLLKGGGCENVSGQAALPDVSIGAGRDMDGVRKAVLKIVDVAQGRGCSPGVIGVCVGGDRAMGYALAKEQLLRPLGDRNPDRVLARLERTLLGQCNQLEIGPMGFGGRTTILAVKAVKAHRLPASFFVTVAYACWSLRRAHLRVARGKATFADTSFLLKAGGR
jgi:fumarate hydratase class I